MIDRNSENYKEARWRVKIGHAFLEKGYDIKGVVHVGANDGYEVQYYLQLGIENAICFEPLPSACRRFRDQYHPWMYSGKVRLFELALGNQNRETKLYIAPGDGQGSSQLLPTADYQKEHPEYDYTTFPPLTILERRFADLVKDIEFDPDLYDCLTIDTQGTELEVLQGFENYLKNFKYLNIECSSEPVYECGAPAQEVIDFLKSFAFIQDSPTEIHNDIFFIREDIKK